MHWVGAFEGKDRAEAPALSLPAGALVPGVILAHVGEYRGNDSSFHLIAQSSARIGGSARILRILLHIIARKLNGFS